VYAIDPSGVAVLRDYFDGFWTEAVARYRAAAEDEQRRKR
jgi:hypothetical protein